MDYCHWHHHQHLCFIGPDISVVANGWLCLHRLIISPSRLTYYANADECLRHYHRLLHCYWLDHRHRHLHHVGCVCRRQVFSSSSWLVDFVIAFDLPRLSPTDYFAAMATQLYLWAPSYSLLPDLTVADWFLRLHGYATSLPLIGVTVFTTTDIFRYFWWAISSSCWSFHLHADCVSYCQ